MSRGSGRGMSRDDGFGFTQLVEDDDAVSVSDLGRSYLDLELQPHLSTHNKNNQTSITNFEASNNKWQSSTLQELNHSEEQHENEIYFQNTGHQFGNTRNNIQETTANAEISFKNNHESSEHTSNIINQPTEQSTFHIQYSATDGRVNVLQGQLGTSSGGSHSIDTQGIQEQWSELQRPLRQQKIKCLKILSIFACMAFFPFGSFAVYFAFRTETEFNDGILKGNIDRAQKFAKRTERLIIISFIMFLIVVALIVIALVKADYSRSAPRGAFMG